MLARSKLNSIESKISEALINNEIRHEDFKKIINEGQKYRELKESFRMQNSQRSCSEETNLIEEGKKILSRCAICGSKKSRFIKNQEAKGLLNKQFRSQNTIK